jgi:hypothetical protein
VDERIRQRAGREQRAEGRQKAEGVTDAPYPLPITHYPLPNYKTEENITKCCE